MANNADSQRPPSGNCWENERNNIRDQIGHHEGDKNYGNTNYGNTYFIMNIRDRREDEGCDECIPSQLKMDPIPALGLAANILQFFDLASKIIETIWDVYKSNQDVQDSASDLLALATSLHEVCKSLGQLSDNHTGPRGHDQSMPKLARKCYNVACGLVEAIGRVNMPCDTRKRDDLKAAMMIVWKGDEVKELEDELSELRDQFSMNLLISFRAFATTSLENQEKMLSGMEAIRKGSKKESVKIKSGIAGPILDFLTSKLQPQDQSDNQQSLTSDIFKALGKEADAGSAGMGRSQPASVAISVPDSRRRTLEAMLISGLRYHGMEDREDNITEAHQTTFQWIFAKQDSGIHWDSLRDWLESDEKLYWITGKLGSGKSTLMKYVCYEQSHEDWPQPKQQSARCEEFLRKWAAKSELIIASFYFWNSGIPLQKWITGFFMSLLYQILKQCPRLIPLVAPSRWEALCFFDSDSRDWTEKELQIMLLRSAKYVSEDGAKLCLFIDGLDEFAGNHAELIRLFHAMLEHPNVKLCVASRPWVEFEDAFQHSPSLMLQDLTRHDIKLYISSSFHQDTGFRHLSNREPDYAAQLIENIVEKSSGVFLWVKLVVVSLLMGMKHGDRIQDLQKRLDDLPPELEKLYESILLNLDPFYLEHAAQLFKLVDQSPSPPSLLLLFFADEAALEWPLGKDVYGLSAEDLSSRVDTMRRRLNSRFKGLLEVKNEYELRRNVEVENAATKHQPGLAEDHFEGQVQKKTLASLLRDDCTVHYLHGTVKDYFEGPELRDKLSSVLKTSFDPHLRLLAGNLAVLKIILAHEKCYNNREFLLDFTIEGDSAFLNARPSWELLDRFVHRFIGGKTSLSMSSFWGRVDRCLFSASMVNPSHRSDMIALMDELDQVGKILARYIATHPESQISSTVVMLPVQEPLLMAGNWVILHPFFIHDFFGGTFLSLAVHRGVVGYVEAKTNGGCLIQKIRIDKTWDRGGKILYRAQTEIWPLLLDALYVDKSTGFKTLDDSDMVACLLRKGADPNKPVRVCNVTDYPDKDGHPNMGKGSRKQFNRFDRCGMDRKVSGWVQALAFVGSPKYWTGREFLEPLASIVRMMVEHGADVSKDAVDLASEIFRAEFRSIDKEALLQAIRGIGVK